MKIFFVLHGFPPQTQGGTERAVEALALALQAGGHEVTIVAGSLEVATAGAVTEDEFHGLRVLRLHRDDLYHDSWWKTHHAGVSAAFVELLERERPDVVHVHHWIRLTSDLVRIARRAGCVTAVTMHDYFVAMASPVRHALQTEPSPPSTQVYLSSAEVAEAFAFHRRDLASDARAAHVRCAPSRSHADGLAEMAALDLGDIVVTPPPLLEAPPRRDATAGARQKRLVTWGSIYPEKGLEIVLDALRQVAEGWSLEVWGEAHSPDYRERIEQLAKGLPVQFRGGFRASDLAAVEADYAVLPSLCHESYGLVMDEALALGLPVIASDLPAYRERAPERSSLLYTPGDVQALVTVLRDEAGLADLRAPEPPVMVSATDVAATLVEAYRRAERGECDPGPLDGVADAERTLLLFRRAERRLWTGLQQSDPAAPPDEFLS